MGIEMKEVDEERICDSATKRECFDRRQSQRNSNATTSLFLYFSLDDAIKENKEA